MTVGTKNEPNSTEKADEKTPEYVRTYGTKSYDDYGYYFYPSRVPGKVAEPDRESLKPWGFIDAFRKGGFYGLWSYNPMHTFKCRVHVQNCAQKDERVKMMLRAMKAHGCPVDLNRHISCESCKLKLSGGFDTLVNQVVVCENNVKNEKTTCNVVAHELLHAFDKCRAKFDPTSLEHSICTEIRAANLFHCHMLNAFVNGEARLWDVRDRHKYCVKRKAVTSVMLGRNVTPEQADEVCDRVFNRCYNDLEPFGRRLRHWTHDVKLSLHEGLLYGYSDDRPSQTDQQSSQT